MTISAIYENAQSGRKLLIAVNKVCDNDTYDYVY